MPWQRASKRPLEELDQPNHTNNQQMPHKTNSLVAGCQFPGVVPRRRTPPGSRRWQSTTFRYRVVPLQLASTLGDFIEKADIDEAEQASAAGCYDDPECSVPRASSAIVPTFRDCVPR